MNDSELLARAVLEMLSYQQEYTSLIWKQRCGNKVDGENIAEVHHNMKLSEKKVRAMCDFYIGGDYE